MSPRGFVLRAAILVAAFAVAHLAGLRDHVGVLSGTPASGVGPLALGCAYVVLYFGAVLVAPILAIAAALWAAWERLAARRASGATGIDGGPGLR